MSTFPTLMIAGRQYVFAPNLRAYLRFRDMTGIDPTDLTTIDSAPNIGELLQTLIWCSVVEQDPSVTMEQVRSAMTLRSMLGLLGAYRTPAPSIAPVGNN